MHRRKTAVFIALLTTLLVGGGLAAQPVAGAATAGAGLAVGQAAKIGGRLTSDVPKKVPAAATRRLPEANDVAPGGEVGVKKFRPTISEADLQSLKNAAAAAPATRSTTAAPVPLAPPALLQGPFEAATQADCPFSCRPPDPIIAAGGGVSQQVVHVGNSFVKVFDHSGFLLLSANMNVFMGLPPPTQLSQILFDPRVIYDEVWNRWIITADEFAQSPTVQFFDMAISQGSDATGPFFIYRFNVTSVVGDFFDYPSLGMDQDGVIITANIFNSAGQFKYAETAAVAKARLYNGLGFGVPLFIGLAGTLQPPHVIQADQNASAFLLAARPSGNTLQLYRMNDSANPAGTSVVLQANVPVPAYTVPPRASQPGTTTTLDTLDSRFVAASTQFGSFLYNVHAIAFGAAALRWYKIDTNTNAVVQSNTVSRTATSADWNGSLAANANDEVFLGWSSVDTGAEVYQASLAVSGKQGADAIPGNVPLVFTSPTFSTQGRWGDYSGMSLDPVGDPAVGCAEFRRAWLANEGIVTSDFWDTQAGQAGFC